MKFTIKREELSKIRSDAVVLGFFQKDKKPRIFSEGLVLPAAVKRVISSGDFQGKLYQTQLVYGGKGERFILLGLGKQGEFKANSLRGAASKAGQVARGYRLKTISFSLSLHRSLKQFPTEDLAQTVGEGLLLGHYRYLKLKSDDSEQPKDLREILIVTKDKTTALKKGFNCARIICDAVFLARDLATTPGNLLTPTLLAKKAKKEVEEAGITCQILDEKEIKRLKMGGILGVSQGSSEPPRLIILHYNGAKKSEPPLALVGKGITFDSGGISIKPSSSMEKMKEDMGGAAAVISAIIAVSRLKLPVNVVGVVPSAENLPSGKAYKPGDVLTTYSGKTVEVINTDAEGRLILMDALAYSLKFKPAAIFDLATLTGACVVALGESVAGIMSRHPKLIRQLENASRKTGERVWELPLWKDYAEQLKSDIADLKNMGGRWGGTITAGCFLAEFVEDKPWAHIDIAGPVWTDKDEPYQPKGATGFGVRLMVQLIREWTDKKPAKNKK
jgi:leucyl aminopeptidase